MHSSRPAPADKTYVDSNPPEETPTPEEKLTNRHARRVAKRRGRFAERAEARTVATAEADEARAIAAIRAAAAVNRKFHSGGL